VLYVKVYVKASEESENCLRQKVKFINKLNKIVGLQDSIRIPFYSLFFLFAPELLLLSGGS
jgi:hypothetical protein